MAFGKEMMGLKYRALRPNNPITKVWARWINVHAKALEFTLPPNYKPNKNVVKHLPWSKCMGIWLRSFQGGMVQRLQNRLVELEVKPTKYVNHDIRWENVRVPVDDEGNWINEIVFELKSQEGKPVKHVVFIHGYGAALGCFARNFQLINYFKDTRYNYKIHFLDNITFGLSSNPKMENDPINHYWIEKSAPIRVIDTDLPTDPKKLYKKYYKLVDEYHVDSKRFEEYQETFKPILKQLEDFYCGAIDLWRKASGIDKIDYLVGHSYGGYWSGSYAVRYPDNFQNLVLLSPVGVERHFHAVTNDLLNEGTPVEDSESLVSLKPTLDPTSFNFLSRIPILGAKHVKNWYYVQPFLPRLLKWMGPWGVQKYYEMWYLKLFKINKVINSLGGGAKIFQSDNDLVYGTNTEVRLIIEYLYNTTAQGSNSDIYIKHLLTPSTVSKWPLYDKYLEFFKIGHKFRDDQKITIAYGQFDFMNSEAGEKLVELIKENMVTPQNAKVVSIKEGGHNLYIDNPFDTNSLLQLIVCEDDNSAPPL